MNAAVYGPTVHVPAQYTEAVVLSTSGDCQDSARQRVGSSDLVLAEVSPQTGHQNI